MKKILIIGSGPIVIGQAAEFDYSGTQACLAAREEGVQTVLVNSNPATIQTDNEIADIVYIEPLTSQFLEKIIRLEKPDGIMGTVGGQTALNLVTDLSKKGILKKYNVKVLGTNIHTIQLAEDRKKFKELMQKIREPVLSSKAVYSLQESKEYLKEIGLPVIIRSSYTLGGTGGAVVNNYKDFKISLEKGITSSPIKQVLIEKSIEGWGEFEYEIIRDKTNNCLCICTMENIDSMGIHTGESMVVAPTQTLSDDQHQMLRNAAFKIVNALSIEGACNVQFAVNSKTGKYFVIEVNPRLSRSSALASKATGYPIAKVATKIALGKNLPEIKNDIIDKTAFFEPTLDYIVIKIPIWPYDKFPSLNKSIGVTMKSTGEVMAIGRNFEEAMYKAIESLDQKNNVFAQSKNLLKKPNMQRLTGIFTAIREGFTDIKISKDTHINIWFIQKLRKFYEGRKEIFSHINNYKMVDTCAGEFNALTPYFYSTHGVENEALSLPGPKVIILGSGPIRIGQGIEFDYLTVHAVKALREKGIKAIIINNNPETVSTDYSISDRLYFEPLTPEFVLKVIENEKEGLLGVIPSFGGQTAINLVKHLEDSSVKILGANGDTIEKSENRGETAKVIEKLGYSMPLWKVAHNKNEITKYVKKLGFPILLRPSYVIGGEGMIKAYNQKDILNYLDNLGNITFDKPILVDKFLDDATEVDIDFICDGEKTICFILEQIEKAGIHSGDSSCVFPSQNLSPKIKKELEIITHNIAMTFNFVGIGNLQCAIQNNKIYILEINPRASRTVPFVSKCIGISLAKIATRVIMGEKLPNLKQVDNGLVAIKTPVFSSEKLDGLSTELGPLMKSTGEKMSIGKTFEEALMKSKIISETVPDANVYKISSIRD